MLVVDLELPGSLSAIGLIGRARETNRHILPIVYTIHDSRDALFAAIHAGAVGYVLKGESLDALTSGILDAVEGRAPISPAVARYFVEAFRAEVPAGDVKPLTDRETELLQGARRRPHLRRRGRPDGHQPAHGPLPRQEDLRQAPRQRPHPGDPHG